MESKPERTVARVKRKILELGPIHPGRITKQYNVCGTPGCRCKDPKNPKKHGPYHYLSYTFAGKGGTLFIPRGVVAEMERRTKRYAEFKKLCSELIEASMQLAKEEVLRRDEKR